MTAFAALAALTLMAAQASGAAQTPAPPAESSSAPAPAAPAPSGQAPTIDSILEQAPMDEDARQAAVRAAFDAAQARRGGLDGRWRLTADDGRVLYVFQFSDPGQIPDPRSSSPGVPVIEGSWLDPGQDKLPDGSGFLSSAERQHDDLTLSFEPTTDARRGRTVVLHRRPSGDWVGRLEAGGASQPVVMSRY